MYGILLFLKDQPREFEFTCTIRFYFYFINFYSHIKAQYSPNLKILATLLDSESIGPIVTPSEKKTKFQNAKKTTIEGETVNGNPKSSPKMRMLINEFERVSEIKLNKCLLKRMFGNPMSYPLISDLKMR